MNKTMQNLFTTDDIDGVISAALYHAKTRQIGGGIRTFFGSRTENSTSLKTLHAYIRLGMSQQITLPETRIVMLVGLDSKILEELTFEDVSTYHQHVVRLDRPHYKPNFLLRPILRLGAKLLTKYHDKEEAAIILANWLYLIV